jgi:hypothetical protein
MNHHAGIAINNAQSPSSALGILERGASSFQSEWLARNIYAKKAITISPFNAAR